MAHIASYSETSGMQHEVEAILLQGAVLIGSSTGCQDAVRYVQRHKGTADDAAAVLAVILQAPVHSAA